ncbi:hypothetical protein LIER_37811 [Lithospermum erythrorhizon]|uniref:Reverse transcriptase domain-containing protein n=1 Tax=Lithospermum erythrorhizon TaxID=34254 RepID=A0AAV3PRI9_LITER
MKVEHLQKEGCMDQDLLTEERNVRCDYNKLLLAEETLLRANSRVIWLDLGDANNRYFHSQLVVNHSRNRICRIKNKDGNLLIRLEEVVAEVEKPETMKEFRPIACCNIIYKCIAKVLVGIEEVISKFQSAFVSGRHIADNVMMMQELVSGYNKNKGKPRTALKIDLMKAYDMVSWECLWEVMRSMEFPARFVFLVERCVTTARFSVCFNGTLHGNFKSGRGLRQGDPLSPYLFLLVMELFGGIMKTKRQENIFCFHPRCQEVEITHLFFADDMFIMCGADKDSITCVKEALEDFEELTGLKPNLAKSICIVLELIMGYKLS